MSSYPSHYNAVYGGAPVAPPYEAALGGLDGVRQQLNASNEAVRVAALQKALSYGEAGLDLVIEVLRDDFQNLKLAACEVLFQCPEAKAQSALNRYGSPHRYDVVTVNQRGKIIQQEQKNTGLFREYLGTVALDLVPIPGGTFLMGSPETEEGRLEFEVPQHQVTLAPFWMGMHPVTQAQYEVVMGKNPSHFKGANRPVEQVMWHDAVEFCQRLAQQTGRLYRLPSEAEWEYACRARTTTPFHFGQTITPMLANYDGLGFSYGQGSKGMSRKETAAVGNFPSNAFGLCDMHGNVLEWCQDQWCANYEDAPADRSTKLAKLSIKRVVRGGSWISTPWFCRSASRFALDPDDDNNITGFRVVCSYLATL
ncbi:MAG: hypothetical protein RLZZ597_2350 [Cyanobacteriota bacterium]|jgi:formylglycine-generating enzyme required for sulfatase activity